MEDSSVCCTFKNSHDDRAEELSTSLLGQLKINDGNRADTINDAQRYYIEEEEEEEDEDDLSEEALLAQMGYVKSDPGRDNEEEEEDLLEDSILVKKEATNVAAAELNLVSALRGSREKEGRAAEECRVSWAADVYDPPCTSDDHFAVSKNERQRGEQKGKGRNRQKGGGSEGGSAKAAGGSKNKKKADKKHKKHGHKYSDPG